MMEMRGGVEGPAEGTCRRERGQRPEFSLVSANDEGCPFRSSKAVAAGNVTVITRSATESRRFRGHIDKSP